MWIALCYQALLITDFAVQLVPDAFTHYLLLFVFKVYIVIIYVGGELNVAERGNRGEELDVMMTKTITAWQKGWSRVP